MRNVVTRRGYEFWDKICALPSYGFLMSPDKSRIQRAPDVGNWIDKHEAQAIVDQAQEEINGLTMERDSLRAEVARLQAQLKAK